MACDDADDAIHNGIAFAQVERSIGSVCQSDGCNSFKEDRSLHHTFSVWDCHPRFSRTPSRRVDVDLIWPNLVQ